MTDGKKVEGYTKGNAVQWLKHPGRNEIPAHIERKYIDLYPEDLPEDAELFDKIETEQLEYDLARLFAMVYRRHKRSTAEFFIAELPDEKDKSLAAPSLKAHVTTEKYLYHMPIYGQVQKIAQSEVLLADTSVGDWINGALPEPDGHQ